MTGGKQKGGQSIASQRHVTALKLSQELNNSVHKKTDILSDYTSQKIEFMNFKKSYYKEKNALKQKKYETLKDILNVLKNIEKKL